MGCAGHRPTTESGCAVTDGDQRSERKDKGQRKDQRRHFFFLLGDGASGDLKLLGATPATHLTARPQM